MADGQSYKTTGTVTAGKFVVTGGATNDWDLINFQANVTSDITMHANGNITQDADGYIASTSPTYSNCTTSSTLIQSVGNVSSISSSGYIKIDGDAGVIIDSGGDIVIDATGDLNVDADNVDIYGSTSLQISAQGGRAILLDADIDLQTGGELQINGTKGKTGWFDDGVNFRVTVTKGLITNMTNTVSAGWSSD
jgi:hypothetical protein